MLGLGLPSAVITNTGRTVFFPTLDESQIKQLQSLAPSER
jgi:hypothetical protein